MKRARGAQVPRDQDESPFSTILQRLCLASGALAAALVDREGETVDYTGCFDPYEIKVAAAEWQIVLSAMRRSSFPEVRGVEQLFVQARRRTFALFALSDGYALVLLLHQRCFRVSRRAVSEAVRGLELEAGLSFAGSSRRRMERWTHVRVRWIRGNPRRPEAIWLDGAWSPLTILGRFHTRDLARREAGYRVQLASGAEFALVREPPGRWFAEDL